MCWGCRNKPSNQTTLRAVDNSVLLGRDAAASGRTASVSRISGDDDARAPNGHGDRVRRQVAAREPLRGADALKRGERADHMCLIWQFDFLRALLARHQCVIVTTQQVLSEDRLILRIQLPEIG